MREMNEGISSPRHRCLGPSGRKHAPFPNVSKSLFWRRGCRREAGGADRKFLTLCIELVYPSSQANVPHTACRLGARGVTLCGSCRNVMDNNKHSRFGICSANIHSKHHQDSKPVSILASAQQDHPVSGLIETLQCSPQPHGIHS